MLTHGETSNSYTAFNTLNTVKEERKSTERRKNAGVWQRKKIKGHINLSMFLYCFPEDSHSQQHLDVQEPEDPTAQASLQGNPNQLWLSQDTDWLSSEHAWDKCSQTPCFPPPQATVPCGRADLQANNPTNHSLQTVPFYMMVGWFLFVFCLFCFVLFLHFHHIFTLTHSSRFHLLHQG